MTQTNPTKKAIKKVEKKIKEKIDIKDIQNINKIWEKIEKELKRIKEMKNVKWLFKEIKFVINASTVRPIAIEKITKEKYWSVYNVLSTMAKNIKEKTTKEWKKKWVRLIGITLAFPKWNSKNKLLYDYSINIWVFGWLMKLIWDKLKDEIWINKITKEDAKKKAIQILSDYLNTTWDWLKEALKQVWTKKFYNMLVDIITNIENKESLKLANFLLSWKNNVEVVNSIKDLREELHKRDLWKANKIKSNNVYIIEILKEENVNTKEAIQNFHNIPEKDIMINVYGKKDDELEANSFEANMKNQFLETLKDIKVYLKDVDRIERLITKDIIDNLKKELLLEKTIIDEIWDLIDEWINSNSVVFKDETKTVTKNEDKWQEIEKIKIIKTKWLANILKYVIEKGEPMLEKLNNSDLVWGKKQKIVLTNNAKDGEVVLLLKKPKRKTNKTNEDDTEISYSQDISMSVKYKWKKYKFNTDKILFDTYTVKVNNFYIESWKDFFRRLDGEYTLKFDKDEIINYYLNNLNDIEEKYPNVSRLFLYYYYLGIYQNIVELMRDATKVVNTKIVENKTSKKQKDELNKNNDILKAQI